MKKLEAELDEVRDKLQDEDEVRLTKEEFFRFLETAHLQMRNGDFEQKDLIAKTLFSKLYLDHKNRLTVLWKPEFDGLISSPNVHNGEPGGIRLVQRRPVFLSNSVRNWWAGRDSNPRHSA